MLVLSQRSSLHIDRPRRGGKQKLIGYGRFVRTDLSLKNSDFKDATSQDPHVRRELADLIRDASVNVSFIEISCDFSGAVNHSDDTLLSLFFLLIQIGFFYRMCF